jgi:adenylate cyclase
MHLVEATTGLHGFSRIAAALHDVRIGRTERCQSIMTAVGERRPVMVPIRRATREWKHAYEVYLRGLALRCLRIAAPLVVFVFVLDGVVERVFRPSLFWWSFWVRIIASFLILALLASSYRQRAERFAFAAVTAVLLVVAGDIETVILKSGGLASPFTSGIALLIIAAALFVPYSGRQMVVASAALWGIYLLPITLMRTPMDYAGAWTQSFLLACATVIAITASRFTSSLREQEFMSRQALAEEERKSEHLLLNILPSAIAARLKEKEQTIADGFAEVSILFADIVGFTRMSARMPPDVVVGVVNEIFSIFDELTERRGLEKIKTIGDAYMVAGGLPEPRSDHLHTIAELALDMREAVDRLPPRNGERLQIRIGINMGPVVAGVIGRNKFAYDLWGDAVNTAARMESSGVPGHIQVTQAVYARLRERYVLEERGTLSIKGKGGMTTYFLAGRRAETMP